MQLKMSTADANKPENSFLNRYRDVKPYDHSRVKLETHHDTDYINASLVKVKTARHLPLTIKLFEVYIYTYTYWLIIGTKSQPKIYISSRTSTIYTWSFLVDGLGAKLQGSVNVEPRHRKASEQMPPILVKISIIQIH